MNARTNVVNSPLYGGVVQISLQGDQFPIALLWHQIKSNSDFQN